MTRILGLDIGGANTKFALIELQGDQEKVITVGSDYFPFWQRHQEYPQYLKRLKKKLSEEGKDGDYVVFVTTAELADCFQTKKEGIVTICKFVSQEFMSKNGEEEPLILDVEGRFLPASKAADQWLKVSATNWVAAAEYIGKNYPNSMMIDIGSTTTDFIAIFNGKVVAEGKNDLERLICSELVYSGLLRTNVATIIQSVKLRDKTVPLASELFATTGDVYLFLEAIAEEDFSVETADGKPASKEHSAARLARVVCADTNQLSFNEIKQIAEQVKKKHFEILSQAMNRTLHNYREKFKVNPKIVLVGSGAKSIGIPLLRENGIYEQALMDEIIGREKSISFTAIAVASVFADTLREG